MRTFNNLLWCSLCIITLSGCASKKEIISLPSAVQNNISSTDVYIEECEKKIKADIDASNITKYTGGGLLFALVDVAIDSHREKRAENALADMQKEVQTFNFQEKYKHRIAQVLQNAQWLQVKKINYLSQLNDLEYKKIFNKAHMDAVFTSRFVYKLSPEFNVLTGTLYLAMYPTSHKIKEMVNAKDPLKKPIFKVALSATEPLTQASEKIDENAKLWGQNDGFYLKKGLENILNQVFVQLDQVLRNPNHLPGE